MRKVAFYINKTSLSNRDFSTIMDANPGIGGSEYEALLVSYLLQKRENGIEPYLFVNFQAKLPHHRVVFVKDMKEMCLLSIENGIDEVVLDLKNFDKRILDDFGSKLNVIVWTHNSASQKDLDLFHQLPYVRRIVNVSREQMELYRDHMATLKSTYVYNINIIHEKEYYTSKMGCPDNHNVVYMGSLISAKSFHVLAKAWKRILKRIPDAHLYVIGSGKLYNANAILGKYDIAEESYEQQFMPYLTDVNGDILPSVHFMGLLGKEKYEVMGMCKVGVPNPTGNSETFCICGVEMQLMGCNITTKRHEVYLDTIHNHKYLYKNEKNLADYVVKRLCDAPDNYDDLYNFVSKKFGIKGNIERWEDIILNINSNKFEPLSSNKYQMKWLKQLLLKLKLHIPFMRNVPLVCQFYAFSEKIYRRFNQG